MSYETVLLDLKDSVAMVTLNRPEKLNALNYQLVSDLDAALTELEADDSVRVIIVTGAGRAFCAGADLTGVTQGEASRMGALLKRMIRPWNMTKPVIAAINGPAVGGGITIPMMFDIRIAAESARMGFVFTRRAAMPELFSTFFLPRQIGLAKASDLLISGRIFGAQEALQLGIVSQVWPDARAARSSVGFRGGHRTEYRAGFDRDDKAVDSPSARRAFHRTRRRSRSPGDELCQIVAGHFGRCESLYREARAEVAGQALARHAGLSAFIEIDTEGLLSRTHERLRTCLTVLFNLSNTQNAI